MTEVKLSIRVRIEELPTVAGFLKDSLVRDLKDFTAYIPDFNAAYVTALTTKMEAVDAIVNPKKLTGEQKLITQRIATNEYSLQELMSKLEGYVKRATGLTVGAKDFGIKPVRDSYNKDDQEGLDDALKYVLANITDNFTALKAKGYTAAQQTALQTIKDDVRSDNAGQNAKESERNILVQDNYILMNELWSVLIDIADAGKRVYKTLNPAKIDDYNMSAIKRRIRQEQKKSKLTGAISANGQPVAGATVAMKPAAGGRSKSAKTKADGSYEIKDLIAQDYIVTVSADGFAPKVISVTIKSGEATVADVVLG